MKKESFNFKKIAYIFACAFLGLLLGFIAHAVIEQAVIHFLVADFDRFSLGFSWEAWFLIHKVFTVFTTLGGIALGAWLGYYWYRIVYERGRGGFVKNVLHDHYTLLKK